MKKLLILFLLLAASFVGHSQQKKKQIKRMLEQIAANKIYIDYLQKGYSIAHSGLQTIQKIKKGDYSLHFNFFDSLQKVNPRIKTWSKVADIISLQLRIVTNAGQTVREIKEIHQFTDAELEYCKKVFDNLLDDCVQNIDELVMIITDGKVVMTDNERIKRLERLYSDMQDKYSFSCSFSNEMGILSAQRLSEQLQINLSKKITGLQ